MIVLFRVDERLVHGQVAVAWCKTLKITHIVVANDQTAKSDLQIAALKMAAPNDVKISVQGLDNAVTVINDPRLADKRVMLVVKNLEDALYMAKQVPDAKEVNLGNYGLLDNKSDRKSYSNYIRLDEQDIECLKKIDAAAPIFVQVTPDRPKQLLDGFLKGG